MPASPRGTPARPGAPLALAASLAVYVGLAASGSPAGAQPTTPTTPTTPTARDSAGTRGAAPRGDALCWRGRPLPRCRSFLLFEFSAPRHLAGTKLDPAVARTPGGHRRWDHAIASPFTYDLGAMRNLDARQAVGATLTLGVIGDDPRTVGLWGVTGRYRRWLGRGLSVEALGGVLRYPVGVVDTLPSPADLVRRVSVRRPAATAGLRVGFGDLVAVTGRAVVATDGRGRTHGAILAGASVGSTVTAALTGAYVALFGYYALAAGSGDDVTLVGPDR